MRIAVLCDIHGNLPAFEAVLKDVARQRVNQLVIAGDIVIGCPDSKDCLELAVSLGCPIVRGNHERYLAHFDTPAASPLWTTDLFTPLQWAAGQVSAEASRRLGDLPMQLRLPEASNVLIVHASERDDHDSLDARTLEAELQAMFPTAMEATIVRGHNHIGRVRLWKRGTIVTAGSVGLPLDGNCTAQYLLLEQVPGGWTIRHQSVDYDLEAALGRFHDTGYLEAAGPMARLFYRELVTATQHIVPFLSLYAGWSMGEGLGLNEAFARYQA